jgi:hypothetical protein
MIITTTIIITIVLGILWFHLYSHKHKLRCYSLLTTSNPNISPQTPSSSAERTQQDTKTAMLKLNKESLSRLIPYAQQIKAAWKLASAMALTVTSRWIADLAIPTPSSNHSCKRIYIKKLRDNRSPEQLVNCRTIAPLYLGHLQYVLFSHFCIHSYTLVLCYFITTDYSALHCIQLYIHVSIFVYKFYIYYVITGAI